MTRIEIETWAQDNFATLALARTVFGFVKIVIATVIMIEIFGWI
mgnify:CR=1 FL=1|tara:strand:+ start:247 stop:378 length:132 start_codon:yes stop_codon:yes gene_type:complete